MKSVQLILGNQLLPFEPFKKEIPIVMIEHHDLCKNIIAFHKIKIAFFFSAMRHYRDELQSLGYQVIYHCYNPNEEPRFLTCCGSVESLNELHMTEIVDQAFRNGITSNCERLGIQYYVSPSPMFMNSIEDFLNYLADVKSPFMKTFYENSRRRFNVLMATMDLQLVENGALMRIIEKCPKILIYQNE